MLTPAIAAIDEGDGEEHGAYTEDIGHGARDDKRQNADGVRQHDLGGEDAARASRPARARGGRSGRAR